MNHDQRQTILAELEQVDAELSRVQEVLDASLPRRSGLFKKYPGDLQVAQRAIADQRRLIDQRNDLRYRLRILDA